MQEGCDKFCTFCVVPYTRGAEVSRPVAKIADDVRRLADNGVREITLIGQNVNAFHGEGPDGKPWPLGKLLHHLAEIDGIARLRYTTSHPCDVDDSLVAAHRDLPALMPYLHLPVQSGSDRILGGDEPQAHGRGIPPHHRKIPRRARPTWRFRRISSSDFPSETEEDFAATLALVEQIGYASAYSFKYSPRPGTPAAEMQGMIDAATMDQRLAQLQQLIDSQQSAFNAGCIGKTLDVLFEQAGRRAGQIVGRSAYLQPVHVMASADIIGQVLPVTLTGLERYSFFGDLPASARRRSRRIETTLR